MGYAKNTWVDGEAGNTPIDADRLNHMEDGIGAATDTAESAQDAATSALAELGAFARVATTGNYSDLSNKPILGTAAAQPTTAFDAAGDAQTAQVAAEAYADASTAAEAARAEGAEDALQALINAINAVLPNKADLVGNKIPTAQLPAISIFKVVQVANQAARLALAAGESYLAKQLDTGTWWVLDSASDPSVAGNWIIATVDPSAAVESVNGHVGPVVLGYADVGADPAGTAATQAAAAQAAAATDATTKANNAQAAAIAAAATDATTKANTAQANAIAAAATDATTKANAAQAAATAAAEAASDALGAATSAQTNAIAHADAADATTLASANTHADSGDAAILAEVPLLDVSGKMQVGKSHTVASRGPIPPATDAHATRVTNDLIAWHTWLAGKAGAITEIGWPCRGKGVSDWSSLAEAWYQTLESFSDQVWVTQWGIEFGDANVAFDQNPYGSVFSSNHYNRFSVYDHVPAGGTLLGPTGRLTLGSSILEHHFSTHQTNRYGVVINAGCNGYVGTTMGASNLTPGRAAVYNPGPTHDTNAGSGGGVTACMTEYNYGTLVAPANTMTTPQFLASRGVGIVRIPIRWERIQPVLGGALSTTELARIDSAVAAYNAAGIGVILDIHNWGYYFVSDTNGSNANVLGDSTVTQAMFVDLWTKMATHYVGMAGVVGYELMNEPAGVATAASWQTISQAAFAAVAAIDTVTPILVGTGGGGDYSQLRNVSSSHPSGPWITGDTHNQVRYVSHHYWDYAGSSAAQYNDTYQQNVTDAESKGFVQSKSVDGRGNSWWQPSVRTGAAISPTRRKNTYWNNPAGVGTSAASQAVAAGTLYLIPIQVERPISIDQVALNWVAHPTAGHVRVGIWAETGNNGRPGGNPLADSGSVAANLTNGLQTIPITFSSTYLGKYWIGVLFENDITGSPTVTPYAPALDAGVPTAASFQNASYMNSLTTTLPNIAADPLAFLAVTWPLFPYRVSAFT